MGGWIPTRLRALIGDDLEAIDAARLQNLIGVAESVDLDFKREPYGTSEGAKKELALDVAAFANGGGGLILIGVDEDGATATELTPVAVAAGEEAVRVHQVVASRIYPTPTVNVHHVDLEEGRVWILSVPPSLRAPHAVSTGDSLRYVVRDGPGRRSLTEAEVADRYGRRFAGVAQRRQHLDELTDEGQQRIVDELDAAWSWFLVALVPDTPGHFSLRRGLADEWVRWLQPALDEFPGFQRGRVTVIPGFRSLDLTDSLDNDGRPCISAHGGRLMVDGSGYLLLGHPNEGRTGRVPEDVNPIYDERLWCDVVNSLGVLARHAIRVGAAGDAEVTACLVSQRPMVLAEYRSMFPSTLSSTHPVEQFTGLSRHTLPVEGCAVPGVELVSSARLVATDLVSAFGLPEPQQLTQGSALVQDRFHREQQQYVIAWAEGAGVDVLPEWTD